MDFGRGRRPWNPSQDMGWTPGLGEGKGSVPQVHWEEMDMGGSHCRSGGCVPKMQGHAWHDAGGVLMWSNRFKRDFLEELWKHTAPCYSFRSFSG